MTHFVEEKYFYTLIHGFDQKASSKKNEDRQHYSTLKLWSRNDKVYIYQLMKTRTLHGQFKIQK